MAWSYTPYPVPTGGQGGSPNNGGFGNGYRNIISQGDGSNAWFLGYQANGEMRLSHQWYNIPVQYPFGQWVHFTVVCDQNNGYTKMYKNGILVAQTTHVMLPSSNGVFRIGRQWDNTGTEDWFGKIDDVQIWSYALTQAEILQSAYDPIQTHESLISSWNFNDTNFLASSSFIIPP